jgi:hypothetical protein
MFNRLNKIMNKIRALGGDKWNDKDVEDLNRNMARDVNLPTLIREKRGF